MSIGDYGLVLYERWMRLLDLQKLKLERTVSSTNNPNLDVGIYTYCDSNYLDRFFALYLSILQQDFNSSFYIICLDDLALKIIEDLYLPNVFSISLMQIEEQYPTLKTIKLGRPTVEYYYALSPVLPLFLFDNYPSLKSICYLDSDLLFFESPSKLFEDLGCNSVWIRSHDYSKELRDFEERFGRFNVGCLIFKNDENARKCLHNWKEKCFESTSLDPTSNVFGDQKYLDLWLIDFDAIHASELKGANVGPWNFKNYKISQQGQSILIDEESLIFYHFQGLRLLGPCFYFPSPTDYGTYPAAWIKLLYEPYVFILRKIRHDLKSMYREYNPSTPLRGQNPNKLEIFEKLLMGYVKFDYTFLKSIKIWLGEQHVKTIGDF